MPNRLGGFIGEPAEEPEKPDCALIGQDGNVFNLVGIAARTLREHRLKDQAKEMTDRVFASGSYGEALCIIGEHVNITDSAALHRILLWNTEVLSVNRSEMLNRLHLLRSISR